MDRRFGVELEHGQPKFKCEKKCSPSLMGHTTCQINKLKPLLIEEFPDWKDVKVDGSGIEVASPILCGDDGFKSLEKVMEFLREQGGKTENADGLHIHHDAPEYANDDDDDELIRKRIVTLAQSWCNNQAIINELVLEHRRADWFKCSVAGYAPQNCYQQVTQATVDSITAMFQAQDESCLRSGWTKQKAHRIVNAYDRFHTLNVRAISQTGTIEIRQYQGTLNFDRARAWIRFGQCFIETALQDDDVPIAPYSTIDTLMRDLGLDSFERSILKEVGV